MRRAGLLLSLAACACASLPRPTPTGGEPAQAGWPALAEGRPDQAVAAFGARLSAVPGDVVALFGRATVAYGRGDSRAALADDLALLQALAGGAHPEWADALAPVAAARVRELYDEIGLTEEAALAARLRPAELARAVALPWPARLELVRLAEEIARRDGDPGRMQREAAAAGCAPALVDAGRLGPLPHLDLRAPAPAGGPGAGWRTVEASGCHVDLAPGLDGRADARLLRAAIEVAEGPYDVVLDDPGEAWVVVDGLSVAHGSARRYGPRVSAARVRLSAGRHELA
ncbi:MAG TPA: hypothetical protein VN962_18970, partial [Polyangia bacterium]|nr:hypothetical protein [Polyangia bacterium]